LICWTESWQVTGSDPGGGRGIDTRPRGYGVSGALSAVETTTLVEAAEQLRDGEIGTVLVADGSQLVGIVTDRDIVVRAIASGMDPGVTTLGEMCSREMVTVDREDSIDHAISLMRRHTLRRLPVMEQGEATTPNDRRSLVEYVER